MSAAKTLRDYQLVGKDFLLSNERVILADDPGVGKTIQALAALDELVYRDHYRHSIAKNIFIVCPASAKAQWINELVNYPRLRDLLHQDRSPIHICTWDHLASVTSRTDVSSIYAVIMDEAHKVKNYTTGRHKAARRLVSRARYRWMLTGTPIDRRPSELLNLLAIISRLQPFGGFWPFALRFCQATKNPITHTWDFTGAADLPELGALLRQHGILLRRTTDVLDLPPLYVSPLLVPNLRIDYAPITAPPGASRDSGLLYEDSDDELDTVASKLAELRSLIGDTKVPSVVEYARAHWANTLQPVIIFAHHQGVCRTIARELDCDFLTGETPPPKRQAKLDAFIRGSQHYLVLSLSLAAEAIDGLQYRASHMIVAELPWTASALRQAIGRIWRLGQAHPVTVVPVIAVDTIDRLVFDLITKKTETSYQLFDPVDDDSSQIEIMQAIRARLAA